MVKNSLQTMLLAGVAAAALAAQPAAAAEPTPATAAPQLPTAAPAADPAADAAATPDIIVTATKRAERLQDVPASVSVVTAANLTQQGAVRFSDYANRIPGLSLTSARTGNTQITLRGITTGSAQPGSTTAFYVDEAPIGSVNAYTGGNGITPDLDPSDLSQIEVLKGPQGTLYGAGAVGGLLKFTTADPSLTDYQGAAQAGFTTVKGGELGFVGRAMVNVPIVSDQLALHVSGFYRRDGGYVDNVNTRIGRADINRGEVRGGRGVLSMRFSPDLRLDLSALIQDTTTGGSNLVDVDAVTLKPLFGDLKQTRNAEEVGRQRLRVYNATIRADLGEVNLVSSTTYQRIYFQEFTDGTRVYGGLFGTLSATPNLGVRLNTIKHTERWSEEARASVNDLAGGILDLQAGFYWTHETDENRIPNADLFLTTTGATVPSISIALPGAVLALIGLPASLSGATSPFGLVKARIDSTYEEYSFFGNARLHIGEKFDVLGGIRYSHDNQTFIQDYRGLLIPVITGGLTQLIAPGTEEDDVVTWLVSPRFRFSSNAMVYARVASGYRPGGPNPAPPTGGVPLTFQPDKLTQYEAGFKASTADRLLSVDAALFYTDWNNIQIQTSAGGFNFLVNGGSARSQGAEATLRLQPTTGLSLGANVGYTDAKLTADAPRAKGFNGDRLPYVPHWSGSLTADYETPLAGDTKLTLGGAVNYTGSRYSDYSGNFRKRLAAYTTVDLRAGLDFGKFSLSAFARNITDERAIVVVGSQTSAANNTAGSPYGAGIIQPRTIGAQLGVRF